MSRAVLLSVAIVCIVGGSGLIVMGVVQQQSIPEHMKAHVWADGWKSEHEVRQEAEADARRSGGGLLSSALKGSEAASLMDPDMPRSGLIATRTLIGAGVVLLAIGNGLLAWYRSTFRGAAG